MKKSNIIKSGFGYIEINPNYLKEMAEDFPSVFTPNKWVLVDRYSALISDEHWDKVMGGEFDWNMWPDELAIPLTFEGRKFVEQFEEDSSVGYNLGDGRAKGLANEYTTNEIWDVVSDPKNGYRMTEPATDSEFKRQSAIQNYNFKNYLSALDSDDEREFARKVDSAIENMQNPVDYYTDDLWAGFEGKIGVEKCKRIWDEVSEYEEVLNS
jgi:hypothetical protein